MNWNDYRKLIFDAAMSKTPCFVSIDKRPERSDIRRGWYVETTVFVPDSELPNDDSDQS